MARFRSAKVLLFDADDNVLVLRRSGTHPTSAFEADLPGGMIENDESHEDGLIREIFEETQLIVESHHLKRVDLTGFPFTIMERTLYVVRLDRSRPAIEISWEHDHYDWLPVESVRELEVPVQRQVDKVIKKGLHKAV